MASLMAMPSRRLINAPLRPPAVPLDPNPGLTPPLTVQPEVTGPHQGSSVHEPSSDPPLAIPSRSARYLPSYHADDLRTYTSWHASQRAALHVQLQDLRGYNLREAQLNEALRDQLISAHRSVANCETSLAQLNESLVGARQGQTAANSLAQRSLLEAQASSASLAEVQHDLEAQRIAHDRTTSRLNDLRQRYRSFREGTDGNCDRLSDKLGRALADLSVVEERCFNVTTDLQTSERIRSNIQLRSDTLQGYNSRLKAKLLALIRDNQALRSELKTASSSKLPADPSASSSKLPADPSS